MRKVAVFFGGRSCEREISVLTGVFVLNLLDREKYDVLPIYLREDGTFSTSAKMTDITFFRGGRTDEKELFLQDGQAYVWEKKGRKAKCFGRVDVALNCCHGGSGEGGDLSGYLRLQEIPVAFPDCVSSGIFMDKTLTKLFCKGLGIPTVDYVRVQEKEYRKRGKRLVKTVGLRLKYPVIVKPARLGSSIGVQVAEDDEGLQEALETAFALDGVAIVEKYLTKKKDVNCAAYSLQGEIILSEAEIASEADGVYDFEKKYVERGGDFLKGGGRVVLNGKLREKIRGFTKLLYKRLGCCGVIRVDFLIGAEGEAYLSEVNAVPGSLAYYLFCESVTDARAFFSDLIEEGVLAYRKERKEIASTGVLENLPPRK